MTVYRLSSPSFGVDAIYSTYEKAYNAMVSFLNRDKIKKSYGTCKISENGTTYILRFSKVKDQGWHPVFHIGEHIVDAEDF